MATDAEQEEQMTFAEFADMDMTEVSTRFPTGLLVPIKGIPAIQKLIKLWLMLPEIQEQLDAAFNQVVPGYSAEGERLLDRLKALEG